MSFTASAKDFWSTRSDRQKILLWIAGAIIAAAAAYLAVVAPAMSARRELSATLPVLRAQVEDMRQQLKEIAILRKKVAATSQHSDLKALLQTSAARASFANAIDRIEPRPGGRALFVAGPANFDDWLDWIDHLQREFGVRLEGCKVASTGQPGLVRIEATFVSAGQPTARATK
ncbi:MAG: type II secretion system protein GspM [Burkholderiales bacterium]